MPGKSNHSRTVLTVLVLAVVFALGSIGGATAAAKINGKNIKKNSVPLSALSKDAIKSLQGAQGPQGPAGAPGAAAARYWAYVTEAGSVGRSSGGVTGAYITNGATNKQYQVTFPTDVSQCGYQVTAGDTDPVGASGAVDGFVAGVSRSSASNNTVVLTMWLRNTPNNTFVEPNMGQTAFYIAVFC